MPGRARRDWIWPLVELAREGREHGARAVGIALALDRAADRVLRAALRDQDHRDAFASHRSAPNRRSAVPGTPIMPAPSRLTSAMFSMVVMPLTASFESGFAQISVPDGPGAKVLRIQIGMLAARWPAPWSAGG
jgi:hypothetical protein